MDWKAFTQAVPNAVNYLRGLSEIPGRADEIAERDFPGSARDASMKNAYRHALGTGMMVHALGGNMLSAAAAKMAGWGWEAPTLLDPRSTAAQRTDSKHDLNANAMGAWLATKTNSQAELEAALRAYAELSPVQQPPGVFERTPGYLTRSVR